MARESVREMVTRDADGNPVNTPMGAVTDYRTPQKDSKTGVVPEFVNVSGKNQTYTVPWNPHNPIRVKKFQILRGAQWRKYFNTAKHPICIERQQKDGKFDPKYLLAKEQMLAEIDALGSIKPRPGELIDARIMKRKVARIEALVANSVIGEVEGQRLPDDRDEVAAVAQRAVYKLRQLAEKATAALVEKE